MLAELRIDNLLLIAHAHIEFVTGLNAFTGETGAGKSLLVDALGFLLGARGDIGMVRHGAAQAEVSARFILSDPELAESFTVDLGLAFERHADGQAVPAELVLSRALPRSGRARAYANGRPIALAALKELGERLLDIHGQDENQSLLRGSTRLEILDRFANATTERSNVRRLHGEALAAARALAELRRAARDRQGREDLTRFQLKELDEADLENIDPEKMDGEARLLRAAEKVRAAALAAQIALDGDENESAATLLGRAMKMFGVLGDAGVEAAALNARLESLLAEISEAARDAAELAGKARSDPERLSELDDARMALKALERKHGRDLAGLRALHQKLKSELGDLEEIDTRTDQREQSLVKAVELLRGGCEKLSRKRRAAARDLEKRVSHELSDLGLKGARLQVTLTPHATDRQSAPAVSAHPHFQNDHEGILDHEASKLLPPALKSTGAESLDIYFSANQELEPRPLKECASGGEISRVMLALKGVLARMGGADRLPVVVFDEIDSGVGGRLGAILGRKLSELSRIRQVICVTHQPQIAAYAQRQLKVEKSREGSTTLVKVEELDGARRIDELAMMLRGSAASAHTRAEAAAMLKEAQSEPDIARKAKT